MPIAISSSITSDHTAATTAKTRVLLTACGSPGSATMIRQLQKHGCYVIGVDMNPEAVGRWMCDEFDVVPAAPTKCTPADEYLAALFGVATRTRADVILPQSSQEVPVISQFGGPFVCPVLVSKPGPIATATNKWAMYEVLDTAQLACVPEWAASSVGGIGFIEMYLEWWGAVIIKPPIGKGSRGVRIIDPSVSMRDVIMDKPGTVKYATLSQVEEAFKDDFPEMLVMEKLEGEELAVDVLCRDGEVLLCCVRTVETQRAGVVMTGEIVDRPEIVEQTRAILKAIPLDWCVNLQFIGGKLIEINPRVSTFIYQDDLCMPWLAIRLALGELSADEIRSYQDRLQIGRRMVRYMDQVFWCSLA